MMKKILLVIFMMMMVPAFAQDGGNNAPIDISADTALEWDRAGARYIARGNARAVHGETTVIADVLTAYYDPDDNGATDLTEVHADTDVQVINGAATVFGQKAIYNLVNETAKVTGDNLKMTHQDMVVTARDHFIYNARAGTITAVGNAVVTQQDKTLKTEKLIAYIEQTDGGSSEIKRIEAPVRVTITTPTETAVGNSGIYNVGNEVAVLTGDVKITQEQNELLGEKAEVNMKTGLSRMFAAPDVNGAPGRVRGTFYPKSDSKE